MKKTHSRMTMITIVTGLIVMGSTALVMSSANAGSPSVPDVGVAAISTALPAAECATAQCSEAADEVRRKSFPPAQAIDPAKPFATKSQVTTRAKSQAVTSSGEKVNAAEAASLATTAVQTTLKSFDDSQGIEGDPLISPDRPVWVVTVQGDMPTDAAPGSNPVVQHVYTAVYDAPTGDLILMAIGVDSSSLPGS